jgi:hypothetical protein
VYLAESKDLLILVIFTVYSGGMGLCLANLGETLCKNMVQHKGLARLQCMYRLESCL